MARRNELRDPTVLLCERCGYDLTGTPRDGKCAECGTPVGESLPGRRIGTPFQQRTDPVTFVRTMWLLARRPRGVWDAVLPERWHSGLFGFFCAVTASVFAWLGLANTAWGRPLRDPGADAAFLCMSAATCLVLTYIEMLGLRLIGRKNGWRITQEVSQAVCGHACVGWIVAGALVAVGWQLGARLPAAPLVNNTPSWMNPIVTSLQFVLPGVGFFVGMMVFETLAYIGVRKLRWANVGEETQWRSDAETE
ncbi:MAG: hypothetical protein KDA20_07795 [Phycisphaerales bacterium]|nr:hypothetical protein [Phycisphaerales bacterium]